MKILFIDLDGTIIDTLSDKPFCEGVWDCKINFEVLKAIKNAMPDRVCIVTNQGGIEKGFVNEQNFIKKIEYIVACIKEYTGIEHIRCSYCTSNNKENNNRKPNTGMLESFYKAYESTVGPCQKSECLMVGDASGLPGQFSNSDLQTAIKFGCSYLDVEDFIYEYHD